MEPVSPDAKTSQNPSSRSPAAEAPPIPDHELIRCVGKGSYGEVWLAKSVMETFRGIKVVYRKTFSSDRPYEREFAGIQKFEPISRTHPGFVSILHIGRNSLAGYFYYVMEIADDLVAGQSIHPESYLPKTLAEIIRRGTLPAEQCLQIALSLTAALGHLHQLGLIHRDIKPSNIIYVNDAPKFADIGLVTGIGEKATFVGTEGYLPPEGPGSPSADIYSLGKVLYEITMGKAPEQFPKLPTRLIERSDAAQLMQLNEIILKACENQAPRRFQSAEEMHAALSKLRRGERISFGHRSSASQTTQLVGALVALFFVPDLQPDAHLAGVLAERFTAEGFETFIDDHPVISLEWARQIEGQIRNVPAVIVLLSAAAIKSEQIAYILEIARQAAGQRQLNLLPVRIQSTGKLPRQLEVALGSATQFRWDGPEDDERLAAELVGALRSRQPENPKPKASQS